MQFIQHAMRMGEIPVATQWAGPIG
jgi:hypothetical protein